MGFNFFNADEIFEMAVQIERNGARFYRRAADGTADLRVRQLLVNLAGMEDEHERVFTAMRADFSDKEKEPTNFDPNNEMGLYLKAMADLNVFDVGEDPSSRLTGKETLEDILRTAIRLEKDSITFYTGMKEMVPPSLGKARIEDIIKEEIKHVAALSNEMSSLKQ